MAKSPLSRELPSKKLEFQDENISLIMSYGMLNEVLKIIGDNENPIGALLSDNSIQDLVIRRLFTDKREPITEIEDLINPFDIPLDPLQVDSVLAWVADHVTHFTISTVEKTQAVVKKYEKEETPAIAS